MRRNANGAEQDVLRLKFIGCSLKFGQIHENSCDTFGQNSYLVSNFIEDVK